VEHAEDALLTWLAALDRAARSSNGAVDGPLLAGFDAARKRAQQLVRYGASTPFSNLRRLQFRHAVEEALPLAAALAACLEAACVTSGQAAEHALQHVQAAATRSCAYLACANLAHEGGPAAGKLSGNLRCRGCKVVWYCGPDCSHADWRAGGHRRVCKALAAAGPATVMPAIAAGSEDKRYDIVSPGG
jgi:hypothetical protein